MTVADLYSRPDIEGPALDRLEAIFVELVRTVEQQVRRGLSERLGASDWLPHRLVQLLASDEIEIARPVISASPLLTDEDLLKLLAECSTEHRLQVALRPGVGPVVSEAILNTEEPLLLAALAANTCAVLPPDGMSRLVSASEHVVSLRQPLIDHPALTEELAERLYVWVGDVMQQTLCARFPHHAEQLKQAISDTVQTLNDARIALKLHDSGRLTPASLLRFLREGRHGLFLNGLALLSEIRVDEVRIMISRPSARQFYLVCLAAGIDRAAFPDVLDGLRRSGMNVPPPLIETELRLGERDRYQAKLELRALVDSLGTFPIIH
ncbi:MULTISPECIES: DUF2336 domain-containing protein [unclassified Brevundimonas]|uniref:DUF2336 domain-containing protein n=1 Tax=unclassified Brevundimonas TaxID=2622653 RepID=UPI0025BD79A1|nr:MULTISPECIES: DUF2336 domain-containing protein [unclassified Brevundimonas]